MKYTVIAAAQGLAVPCPACSGITRPRLLVPLVGRPSLLSRRRKAQAKVRPGVRIPGEKDVELELPRSHPVPLTGPSLRDPIILQLPTGGLDLGHGHKKPSSRDSKRPNPEL